MWYYRSLLVCFSLCVCMSLSAQTKQPELYYGNYQKFGPQETTIQELLSVPKFTVLTKGCRITSFDINGMMPGKEFIGPYQSTNGKLTESQINYIKSLGPGANLWFNHIHVKCKDGTERVLGEGNTEFSIYYFIIKK